MTAQEQLRELRRGQMAMLTPPEIIASPEPAVLRSTASLEDVPNDLALPEPLMPLPPQYHSIGPSPPQYAPPARTRASRVVWSSALTAATAVTTQGYDNDEPPALWPRRSVPAVSSGCRMGNIVLLLLVIMAGSTYGLARIAVAIASGRQKQH